MAQAFIGGTVAAGNAVYADLFTMPAGNNGIIGNITAANTTGGGLTITIALHRLDGTDHVLVNADAIGANGNTYYSGGSTKRITPLVMISGEVLKAQGSGAGIEVTFSGLRIS